MDETGNGGGGRKKIMAMELQLEESLGVLP
jgi:hypothetical protein